MVLVSLSMVVAARRYQTMDLDCSEASRTATAGALRELARRHAMRARTLYLAQRHIDEARRAAAGTYMPCSDCSSEWGCLWRRPSSRR